MSGYSIVLVEDDLEVRQRLAEVIDDHSALNLLASVDSVATGLEALLHHQPDILLTDLGLPDGSGVEIIRMISENHLDTQAMVISGFQDEHVVFSALEAGANAYILKHDESQKITDAIISMMNGGVPISPIIARLMLQKFQKNSPTERVLPESLTDRQAHILKLVSQGFSSREISEKLSVSYYTVTTHIKNIYGKLQVNSRTEALYEARKLGLL